MRERFLSPEGDRYRESFEHDFMCLLEKLVNDLERKFRRGKDRLEVALPAPGSDAAWRAGGPGAQSNPLKDDLEDRRTLLDFQVKDLLARIEAYGEEGRITEAQELIVESEACKAELERLRHLDIDRSAGSSEKRMDVCPTCGALLVVNDAQKRVEAHFEGRQHSGWARIRNALAELKAKFASAPRHHAGGAGREPPPRHEHSRPPPRRPMASSFSSFSSSSSSSAASLGLGGAEAGEILDDDLDDRRHRSRHYRDAEDGTDLRRPPPSSSYHHDYHRRDEQPHRGDRRRPPSPYRSRR